MARRRHRAYDDDFFFPPSQPLPAKCGVKARSKRGAFAKNWWAARWIQALERLMDSGRLQRGRSYARRGQVLSIEETKSGVTARVQGSRRAPYKVTIGMERLAKAEWERVIDALASQALFTAQLLAGEMPSEVESAFRAAGVSLFPEKPGDLITECSCPDWVNPCKHIAAAHYLLGDRFDEDPFLLFRLRGRNQEQILEALRMRRGAAAEPAEVEGQGEGEAEPAPPLEESIAHFWELGEPLESFPLSIVEPSIAMPLLKRLGEPDFLADETLEARLGPAYAAISRAALETAFGEEWGEGDGQAQV